MSEWAFRVGPPHMLTWENEQDGDICHRWKGIEWQLLSLITKMNYAFISNVFQQLESLFGFAMWVTLVLFHLDNFQMSHFWQEHIIRAFIGFHSSLVITVKIMFKLFFLFITVILQFKGCDIFLFGSTGLIKMLLLVLLLMLSVFK